jgi:protein phosphatase
MNITIPERALILLIGVSGSGKSTFARQHFRPAEIVSSDHYRAVVADDENDQMATKDAFDLVHQVVEKRLKRGLLTVIDATNIKISDRRRFLEQAQAFNCQAVALIFDLPIDLLHNRLQTRTDRDFGSDVLNRQQARLHQSTQPAQLVTEGFAQVYRFQSADDMAQAVIIRPSSPAGLTAETGPFDIIGDVHGCYDELTLLLDRLGYVGFPARPSEADFGSDVPDYVHPAGRKLVFVGDLVDRGPDSVRVLQQVMTLVRQGMALCVPGNHDDKLLRKLYGRNVSLNYGLAETWAQLSRQPPAFLAKVETFLAGLPYFLRLDEGRLIVAHAGLDERMQRPGANPKAVKAFCLFGPTTGETDEFDLPVRIDWAATYAGSAMVVYGHTPVAEARMLNNTVNIDTGCCFGGKLTVLRYPEQEFLSVNSIDQYAIPKRNFRFAGGTKP